MTQKLVAQVVGAVLTVVGIAGFFTGGSLLGFGVNTLHNVVHLASGIAGLALGFSNGGKNAHYFNKIFGSVYLLVAVLGFVASDLMASLLMVNMADNLLHLVIGVVVAGVGFAAPTE